MQQLYLSKLLVDVLNILRTLISNERAGMYNSRN